MLAKFYETHHEAKNFEIVFVSSDKDEQQFTSYFNESHGDWLAVPYSERDLKAKVCDFLVVGR
jgi:nucleoredoxin